MFKVGERLRLADDEWEVFKVVHAVNRYGRVYTQARVHLRNGEGETMEKGAMELAVYADMAEQA